MGKIVVNTICAGLISTLFRRDKGRSNRYNRPMTMTDYFLPADDEQIKREKARARELRNSPWWKRKRSSGICYYCGRKFKAAELTMDHLIPLIRGGRSVPANVVPACKACNSRKKYLLPMEWEEYLTSLRKDE